MATLLATPDELTAIGNIDQAKAWAGLSDAAWNGLQENLGQVTSLRVLAALPPHTVLHWQHCSCRFLKYYIAIYLGKVFLWEIFFLTYLTGWGPQHTSLTSYPAKNLTTWLHCKRIELVP